MAVSPAADKRFRRAHVSPARRGHRLKLSVNSLAVAGVVTAFFVYLLYVAVRTIGSTQALTVSRISVTGNVRLSQGEVVALVEDLRGRNMLFVGLESYRQKLLASPWVADAALRR